MSSAVLSPLQSNALFDILTHNEVYSEMEAWKSSDLVQQEDKRRALSPIMQRMFNMYIITLPGIKTLPEEFFQVKVGSIIASLSDAELSESYDKGNLGSRKTMSTFHVSQ